MYEVLASVWLGVDMEDICDLHNKRESTKLVFVSIKHVSLQKLCNTKHGVTTKHGSAVLRHSRA